VLVPDDADPNAEYEEYIDPKTGKVMVRKKDPNNPGVIPGAKKTAVVKVMKDGIKAVMGKDGKMRYFDKDGKEIDEKDAFDEKVIEIDDDGDPNAEYEE